MLLDDTCSIKTVYKEATVTLSACHIPHSQRGWLHTHWEMEQCGSPPSLASFEGNGTDWENRL